MQDTPKGLRRHIAIVGRRNAGKSSLTNALARQEVSIVSSEPGTTTDPVEKTLEINPIGPVVLLDTAGIDDVGELGEQRIQRALNIIRRADLAVLVIDAEEWGDAETQLVKTLEENHIPYLIARNKMEHGLKPRDQWRDEHKIASQAPVTDISAKNRTGVEELLNILANFAGQEDERSLLADLLPDNGLALLVVPIDSGAPKGRLILPQVQAIRDCLDHNRMCAVATEKELPSALLRFRPDLVVCDSQVAKLTCEQTPADIPITTFSILMARFKGDLTSFARGAKAIMRLKPGDGVLIQEACSHHAQKDDIGRVKIPALLQRLAGGPLRISFAQGKELAPYANDIKVIVHCGACMITSKQMCLRQQLATEADIPMTNYGVAICCAQGILPRALAIFPEALTAFNEA